MLKCCASLAIKELRPVSNDKNNNNNNLTYTCVAEMGWYIYHWGPSFLLTEGVPPEKFMHLVFIRVRATVGDSGIFLFCSCNVF